MAQGQSLPELRKACGLANLLVITEVRERWEERLVEIYAVITVHNTNLSARPLSLQLPRQRSLDVAVSKLSRLNLAYAPTNSLITQMPR
jgi:hypothetical protein